jgi:hypothetical protein
VLYLFGQYSKTNTLLTGETIYKEGKGKVFGKQPKAKFLKVLKTASDANTKTSKTCQQYNENIAAGKLI